MMIYIYILILLVVLSFYFDYKNNRTGYNKWMNVCFIILVLLAALRNRVGGDSINYQVKFEEWPNLIELMSYKFDLADQSQPLWFLLNSVLKTIVDDFVILQFFHAIVFNVLLFRFINRTTEKRFTVLLFAYCIVWWNFNFEVLRESLCIAIYLNSLLFLKNGRVYSYFCINIPCFFIHYYSFVMILLTLFIYYINKKTLLILVFLMSSFFMLFKNDTLIDYLMNLSMSISSETAETLVSEDMLEKAEEYLDGDMYGATSLNIFGVFFQFIGMIFPFIVTYYMRYITGKVFFEKLLWLYLLLFIIKANFPIFSRFENYLLILLIVETVNFVYSNNKALKLQKYVVVILFFYTSIKTVREFYLPPKSLDSMEYDCRYFPYTTIFEEPDKIRELYYGK